MDLMFFSVRNTGRLNQYGHRITMIKHISFADRNGQIIIDG